MMCSRGYSLQVINFCLQNLCLRKCFEEQFHVPNYMLCCETQFSGICGSLLLGTGFVGAILTGLLVDRSFRRKTPDKKNSFARYGRMEEVSKLFYGIAGIFAILMAEFMRFGDVGVWIAFFASAFGVFGFGMYPIALELSVVDCFQAQNHLFLSASHFIGWVHLSTGREYWHRDDIYVRPNTRRGSYCALTGLVGFKNGTCALLVLFTMFKATLSFIHFYHNFHNDILALYHWCIQVLQQPLDKEALKK